MLSTFAFNFNMRRYIKDRLKKHKGMATINPNKVGRCRLNR
jgi:hypothetical protein